MHARDCSHVATETFRDGAPRDSLLSALGRLHLQIGDIAGAELCFAEAKGHRSDGPNSREHVDNGLVAVAQNAFSEAYTCFHQANLLEPTNVMVLNLPSPHSRLTQAYPFCCAFRF